MPTLRELSDKTQAHLKRISDIDHQLRVMLDEAGDAEGMVCFIGNDYQRLTVDQAKRLHDTLERHSATCLELVLTLSRFRHGVECE